MDKSGEWSYHDVNILPEQLGSTNDRVSVLQENQNNGNSEHYVGQCQNEVTMVSGAIMILTFHIHPRDYDD